MLARSCYQRADKLRRRRSGKRTYTSTLIAGSTSCCSSAAPSLSVSYHTPSSLQSRGRAVVGTLRGRINCSMCGRARETGNSEPFVVPSAVVPLIHDSSNKRSSHLGLDPSNVRGVIEIVLLVLLELRNFLRLRSLAIISSGSVAWHDAERRVPWWCFSPLEPAKNMGMEAAAHLRFQHMEQTTRLVQYYYRTVGGLWGQSNMAAKTQ